MISADSLTAIAHIFCGDIEGYYSYKSGPKLVSFFNDWLRADDEYGQGFPSRWVYAYDKIAEIINRNSFDRFLGHILSKQFIIQDLNCTEVEAVEKSEAILAEFNRVLGRDQYFITHNGNEYHLVQQNLDLVLIGSGGFANAYYQKSKDAFIVYLGGYHNSIRRNMIRKIFENNPDKKYFHYGDIDAGGFYILLDLRRKTGIPFAPLNMNLETIKKYRDYTKKLTENDRTRLKNLLGGEFDEVINYMLENDCKLEQEAIEQNR